MKRHGFTLVEFLVVTLIILLLIGLGVAGINTMVTANATEAGLTTVSSAVSTTRARATRGLETGQVFDRQPFQGVSLLFTPSDLRAVRHVAREPDGESALLDEDGNRLTYQRTAYRDITDVDYIALPQGSAAVGILRNGSGAVDGLRLLAPPFAIRFNTDGKLIAQRGTGSLYSDRVYYDGDYDGEYDTDTHRTDPGYGPNTYSPTLFDPAHDAYDRSVALDTDRNKARLAFEEIETVLGVIVYSRDAMEGAMYDAGVDPNDPDETWLRASGADGAITESGRDWLLEQLEDGGHARLMLFNRHTGAVMKGAKR